MNKKDMEIKYAQKILSVQYKRGVIHRSQLDDVSKDITFFFRDGRTLTHDTTKHITPECVYLSQFGISVTEDGKYFFIQSWEKGLFCFSVQTGACMWHHKRKRAYHLVTLENAVVCHFYGDGVLVLDLLSGDAQKRIPLGAEADFWALDDTHYMIGLKRGKYHIIDEGLNLLSTIPYQSANPSGFKTFIILKAGIVSDGIAISGFEYSGNIKNVEESRFTRKIEMTI